MPSERIQRRIDALLDQADTAVDAPEWSLVAEKARAVLAMDPENEDAPPLLRAAEANPFHEQGRRPAGKSHAAHGAPSPHRSPPEAAM